MTNNMPTSKAKQVRIDITNNTFSFNIGLTWDVVEWGNCHCWNCRCRGVMNFLNNHFSKYSHPLLQSMVFKNKLTCMWVPVASGEMTITDWQIRVFGQLVNIFAALYAFVWTSRSNKCLNFLRLRWVEIETFVGDKWGGTLKKSIWKVRILVASYPS